MHVRTRRPGGWGDVRLPALAEAPTAADRREVDGGVVHATTEGWELRQGGEVTHTATTNRIRPEVWTALGGRVFAVGGRAYAIRGGELFMLPGLSPSMLFDQDGRVFAARDGTREVVGLEAAWAAADEALGSELDLRAPSFARDPDGFRAAMADPEVRDARFQGRTRLYSAAAHGDVEAVRALLEAGADPGGKNEYDKPAAYGALFTESVETVEALYDAGFRFGSDVEWGLIAVRGQKPVMVRWCIERGLVDERVLHYARQAKAHWKDPTSKATIVALLEEAELPPFDRGEAPEDPELRAVFDAAPYSQPWWHALLTLGKRLEEEPVKALYRRVLRDPGAGMTSVQHSHRGHVVEVVTRSLGPEETYEMLTPGDVKAIALSARDTGIDPRWVGPMLDHLERHPDDTVVGGALRVMPVEALREHVDRLVERGRFAALERARPDHPALLARRRRELAMPEEPDGVARAAACFADDEALRAEVLRQTVEALDHCDDEEQMRPHLERLKQHDLPTALRARVAEIAERFREGVTGHVIKATMRKRIAKALDGLAS